MTRWWTEFVGAFGEIFPLGWAAVILVALSVVIALLWYYYPRWVPRRRPFFLRGSFWRRFKPRRPRFRLPRPHLPRLRWPRLRLALLTRLFKRRNRKSAEKAKVTEKQMDDLLAAPEELPEVPIEVYESLADRLAREGRFAEAVRERLRAAVRDLVVHGVVENRPGWTVSELARAAAAARPTIDGPLRAAGAIFSTVWYAEEPATQSHDQEMRTVTAEVHEHLIGGAR
ncbi:hypothetical protein F4553_003618 [Allocatelliglobosispora scoriae]|uniref:Protein-glutamine gamma-glutamyltransferase-like C-terminal domain-containing protein n=1 Tax=Allocatelliglobosispora scoriae TaxID=643052 RepID=A0A841BSS8_9ACTN|nr:DUF4129 domain-containing protein [Allocatelliglobosispora scoriae]MBB5870239.1 hypothetical protein [Allocatelliglobosispora scoriae]